MLLLLLIIVKMSLHYIKKDEMVIVYLKITKYSRIFFLIIYIYQ